MPTVVFLTAVLASAAASRGASADAGTQPVAPSCEKWIHELGDSDPAVRDAAEDDITQLGKPAVDSLRAACDDTLPEVAIRARRSLRKIRIFLLPDVSDEALSFAQAYLLAPDSEHRKPYLHQLFEMKPQPDVVLTRLLCLEDDDDLHRQLLYQLATGYREAVPRMVVDDDDLTGVLGLLDDSAQMWGQSEAADDAAALFLSGKVDRQIQVQIAELTNGDTSARQKAATQLCYLYRATGQYDQAMKYARIAREPQLVFLVLQDQGDWSAATKENDDRWRDPVTATAFRSAFQRLSGHAQAGVDLMKSVSVLASDDADALCTPSRFFLLNDLPERGIQLLTEQHPAIAFRMRLVRGEIQQAIDIADKYQDHPTDHEELAKLLELLRQSLGELPPPATQPVVADFDNSPADKAWQAAVKLLNDKQNRAAADAFGAMWAEDHSHFDRLYLQGYALDQAGDSERGKKLMEQARLLPLGDPLARWLFAAQLDAAGLTDIAQQQRELGLRCGAKFDELGFSEIDNTKAALAIEHKQWHAAADALDRLCLINLSSELHWHDQVRLLTVPALAHLVKARAAREQHDLPGMLRELGSYQQYMPMSSDLVLEMVPSLDDQGEHAAADELFNGVYEKLATIVQKYPRSVTYLNELAWMSGCCGRRLDQGLKAAQTAVRLEPDDWQVLDTLAEQQFRRGDRAAAVTTEKQATAMSNKTTSNVEYLTRQLKRFESAAIPSTTQPGVAPK